MTDATDATEVGEVADEPEADHAGVPAHRGRPTLGFALRQGALLGLALIVAGSVIDRLRPEDFTNRTLAGAPMWFAALLWVAVMILEAFGIRPALTRWPLLGAGVVAVATLVIGAASANASTDGARRFLYLVTNAAGALAFWWGLFALLAALSVPKPTPKRSAPTPS